MKNLIERTRSNTEIEKDNNDTLNPVFNARTHDSEYNTVLEIAVICDDGYYVIKYIREEPDWHIEEENTAAIKSIVEFLLIEHAIKNGY